MGQLRSGIADLQKTCTELGPPIEAMGALQKAGNTRVAGMTPRVTEGYNVLKMTLIEKFKKENTTFAAQGGRTLKEVADANVATVLKGIVASKNDIKALINKLNTEQKAAADKLLATVTKAKTSSGTLSKLAEKKKAKWLKSAKYKAKIGGYLTSLDQLDADLAKLEKRIQARSALKQDAAWVEKCFKISVDMKVSEIADTSSAEFDGLLSAYEAAADTHVRGFRDEYKHMGNQLATFAKWAAEADAMDAEADAMK